VGAQEQEPAPLVFLHCAVKAAQQEALSFKQEENMGKTRTEIEQSTTVENATFDLRLPSEINVEPWMVVELPRNKQAMIYKVMVKEQVAVPGWQGQVPTMHDATRYDVYIVSKKSMSTLNPGDSYYSRSTQHFSHLPELKHYLHDIARTLSMKRRTKKLVNVEDVREADDDDE
jgi:hypothetical protein